MNSLGNIDKDLLLNIKCKIEALSGLETKKEWVQKDYDFLVFFIEEKTGVKLSLSTVKRIWKNEYNRLPHSTTLDTLSKLAYEKDWLSLKTEWLDNQNTPRPIPKKVKGKPKSQIVYTVLILFLIVLGILFILKIRNTGPKGDLESVSFSIKKSVENTIPNTVVFSYNIEGIKADKFFIQQSWDTSRRVEVHKGSKEKTDIYYIPGFYTARLIADDKVIKEIPVHMTYDDWFMAVRQPISNVTTFDKKHWIDAPYLGINKKSLEAKIDMEKPFQLSYYYVKNFVLDGDNFNYSCDFKMEPIEAISCPNLSIHVQAEKGHYWIMFSNKGCESELSLQLGELTYNGKDRDLTMFGTNIYHWQRVNIKVVDKQLEFKLNGENIFLSSYTQSIGEIKEISYFFSGNGVVDNVELKDLKGDNIFYDDFSQNTAKVQE